MSKSLVSRIPRNDVNTNAVVTIGKQTTVQITIAIVHKTEINFMLLSTCVNAGKAGECQVAVRVYVCVCMCNRDNNR